jgi:hypothetical protein
MQKALLPRFQHGDQRLGIMLQPCRDIVFGQIAYSDDSSQRKREHGQKNESAQGNLQRALERVPLFRI